MVAGSVVRNEFIETQCIWIIMNVLKQILNFKLCILLKMLKCIRKKIWFNSIETYNFFTSTSSCYHFTLHFILSEEMLVFHDTENLICTPSLYSASRCSSLIYRKQELAAWNWFYKCIILPWGISSSHTYKTYFNISYLVTSILFHSFSEVKWKSVFSSAISQ